MTNVGAPLKKVLKYSQKLKILKKSHHRQKKVFFVVWGPISIKKSGFGACSSQTV